jgi:pyruvate/2-oxoacid:ferredoxin oxidoreductase alpha subunit
MARKLVTGNHTAGYVLGVAGEANRSARGCAAGAYPITPQSEVVEFLRGFKFTKGRVVTVESEHSAMAVCIGAALAGARAFTASSSNGLAYMTENVFNAGYYRLPVVMMAVNRTLGPPWNIWADQGDSLALRDAAWIQLYCESHQDVADTTLMAFRLAEDPRILLPAMVAYDGFIISHTSAGVELPEQEQVDRYLPPLKLPHAINHAHPSTVGGLAWPFQTAAHRVELESAMQRVPEVLEEARAEFKQVFGRMPDGAIETYGTEDAEMILIASNSLASTTRDVVKARRKKGEKVGMVKIKLFRPFPRAALLAALAGAKRVGVIDRNHSPGSGGIFWQETAATLQGHNGVLLQDYLVGVTGGDATEPMVHEVVDDLRDRKEPTAPIWKGVAA